MRKIVGAEVGLAGLIGMILFGMGTGTPLAAAADLRPAATPAAKAKQQPPQQPAEGEVDISDVQSQYWKSHDKQFEVIQNRLYTKKNRIELSPLFGIYQRVDFQDAKTVGGSLAYHFSDMFGFEVMGYKIFASDSSILEKFQQTRNATIEYNKEHYYLGANVLFTPIYAKFSFLGTKISHFDMYVSAGGGVTMTNEKRPTVTAALGEKFWITPKWNVRLEYRWLRYEDRVNTTEGLTRSVGYYDQTVNDYVIQFGISYLFN